MSKCSVPGRLTRVLKWEPIKRSKLAYRLLILRTKTSDVMYQRFTYGRRKPAGSRTGCYRTARGKFFGQEKKFSDWAERRIRYQNRREPAARTSLQDRVQKAVKVRIIGRAKTYDGRLIRVEAKASREIYHPALTAMAGGPIGVRQTDVPDKKSDSHELAEAHFMATARHRGL